MDKPEKTNETKDIEIGLRSALGKFIPLEEHPEIVQEKYNHKLAKSIAVNLLSNEKFIQLYKKHVGVLPKKTIIEAAIYNTTYTLLINGLISIKETQTKTKHISDSKRKLLAISEPLKIAKKALDSLDSGTKTDLGMAIHAQKIDLNVISEIINACESITRWNDSPTKYYIPILRSLQEFDRTALYSPSTEDAEISKSKLTQEDWIFFKELISRICFEVFSSLENPPENFNDTKKGLKTTFEKIKETERLYFNDRFPD